MTAVDTNILVHAHRVRSPFHVRATDAIASLAEGSELWAIPWPCVHEFLAVSSNPRAFETASPQAVAIGQVEKWLEAPGLRLLREPADYWTYFRAVVEQSQIVGARIHDARVFAICLASGVRTLWTADRDFKRFSGLEIVNPLVERD